MQETKESYDGSRDAPDPWVVRSAPALVGSAERPILDLACGSGRNALWLARHGIPVVGVDASSKALNTARDRAENLPARFERIEVSVPSYPPGPWGGIVVVHFLDRSLFPLLSQSLSPGACLVYKTHLRHALRDPSAHPRRPEYLLQPGELMRSFPSLRVLDYREWFDDRRYAYAALVARRD